MSKIRTSWNAGTAKVYTCVMCKKTFTYKDTRGTMVCSKDCHKKYLSMIRIGKLNPRFNNGWRQYHRFKKNIDYCEKCNKKDCKLEVHHKDGNNRNNEMDNLIKVCRYCHMEIDGRFKNLDYHNSGTGLCAGGDA